MSKNENRRLKASKSESWEVMLFMGNSTWTTISEAFSTSLPEGTHAHFMVIAIAARDTTQANICRHLACACCSSGCTFQEFLDLLFFSSMLLQLNWKPDRRQCFIKPWNYCIALQEASKFIEIGMSLWYRGKSFCLQDSSKDFINNYLWSDNAMDIFLYV